MEAIEVVEKTIVVKNEPTMDRTTSTEAEEEDMAPTPSIQRDSRMTEIEEEDHPTDVPFRVITVIITSRWIILLVIFY